MKSQLKADLQKLEGMAFGRVAGWRGVGEKFYGLGKRAQAGPDYAWAKKLYAWAFVPLSLWPVDVRGLGLHVLQGLAEGRELDAEARLTCKLLPEAPLEITCQMVGEDEHAIKLG